MKILAIAADLIPQKLGGAEGHFVEVLKRIAKNTEKVTVIVGPSLAINKEFKNYPQVEFININYPHIPNLFGVCFILWSLPKVLKLQDYDLVWAKQEYPQAQVGAIIKIIKKIPLYVTSQNPALAQEELVLKGSLVNFFKRYLSKIGSELVAWSFGHADRVAAVSKYSANLAKQFGAKKVVVIPNGVDMRNYIPHKKSGKNLKIITVSSLISRNGIDILISACELLTINWQLIIAGDGPMFKDLPKDPRISFLGRVANSKIPKLLSENDIFIRPSRFEGFGSSFIEAMAAGVPIIGTRVGGIPDFLKNNQTGLVVPVDNPQFLAKAIERLAKDKILYKKLQIQGKSLVRRKYIWDIIATQVFKEMETCS